MRFPLLALAIVIAGANLAWAQDSQPRSAASPPLLTIDPQSPQGLQDLFRFTGKALPLVSAHRGGPTQGFPENCIATFEDTLQHTYAILEIDPRMTKDGAIVVHHDPTLDRTTTGTGLVAERTLAELQQLRLKDVDGSVTEFRMSTLDELLEWARGKTILVIDQKDVSIETRVRKIQQHQAESYAMLIVYSFQDARQCHRLNKNIMMEVMIPNRDKFHEFDRTGIPWSNIVAFVGHTPPQDEQLLRMIHAKGACCIAGTSRNLDRQLVTGRNPDAVEPQYRELLERGVDLIETDLPREVGRLLYEESPVPESKSRFFRSAATPVGTSPGISGVD